MTKNNLGLPLELKDSSFTLSDRVGILTFERNDMRNALTGTALIGACLCREEARQLILVVSRV